MTSQVAASPHVTSPLVNMLGSSPLRLCKEGVKSSECSNCRAPGPFGLAWKQIIHQSISVAGLRAPSRHSRAPAGLPVLEARCLKGTRSGWSSVQRPWWKFTSSLTPQVLRLNGRAVPSSEASWARLCQARWQTLGLNSQLAEWKHAKTQLI